MSARDISPTSPDSIVELALKEVEKYIEDLSPQDASKLKERLVQSHQRMLIHEEWKKTAEKLSAVVGEDTENGKTLKNLLKTNERVDKTMAELAEETCKAWIKLGKAGIEHPEKEKEKEDKE